MDIVITDWRGVFTAEDAVLETIPHPKNTHFGKLSLLALHHAAHIKIHGLPDTDHVWKKIMSMSPSSAISYHATLFEHPSQARNIIIVSGDASTVLHHSTLPSHKRHALQKEIWMHESMGKLPIGIAFKHTHDSSMNKNTIHELTWIGNALVSFESIQESYRTLQNLKDKNIHVKIFSHMPLHLSRAIARKVGIYSSEDSCLTGNDIAQMNNSDLHQHVLRTTIFSELVFSDEQRIMRVLEEAGHRILHHEFSRA